MRVYEGRVELGHEEFRWKEIQEKGEQVQRQYRNSDWGPHSCSSQLSFCDKNCGLNMYVLFIYIKKACINICYLYGSYKNVYLFQNMHIHVSKY